MDCLGKDLVKLTQDPEMLELTGELAMESDDIEGLEAASPLQPFGMGGEIGGSCDLLSKVKDGDVIEDGTSRDSKRF